MPGTVLWAEDDPDDRELISAVLEDAGVQEKQEALVRFVGDGQELLDALRGSLPDLVVLDMKMPRMGGLEALERVRLDPRTQRLPVVAFSSSKQVHEVQQCLALGVLDYVQKPMAFDELPRAVSRVLDHAVPA